MRELAAEGAEELVRAWEADAQARGIPRLEQTFWEGAAEWTAARAWRGSQTQR